VTSVAEAGRRLASRATHHLRSLPILALNVHTACNCRCLMCDIWMANARGRQIGVEELERYMAPIRRLRVQRVMLTGGEPLLHQNLWRLCSRLRDAGVGVTLVTTGLLVDRHADAIAEHIDELVVSVDGPRDVHDAIRRVKNGYDSIARGLSMLANHAVRPRTVARCVIQRENYAHLVRTIDAVAALAVERLSFLGADVSSIAFNRPQPWSPSRSAEVALSSKDLPRFAVVIRDAHSQRRTRFDDGFVAGGIAGLWRIHQYYRALAGQGDFPRTRCNAPWVSAVVEPGGQVRPCFFHAPYASGGAEELDDALNAPAAVAFRRQLDVRRNTTCRRCVCTMSLGPWAEV
jgi:MoaA/NifB/PqqE/SkfB family radical SAM enzyme